MNKEGEDRIYIEKAHELTNPPDLFAGRIPDILRHSFSWSNLEVGDRLELAALDALIEEPKIFSFELLGRRELSRGGLGKELLVRFIKGSDEFHFYTPDGGTNVINLGSEGLIGVSADLIRNGKYKPSFLMISGGEVGLGRDLAFEDVYNTQGEKIISFCVARKILTGHHFVPQEPIDLELKSEDARFLLRDCLADKRSHFLTREEWALLNAHPDFNSRVDKDVRGLNMVIYSTSIPNFYLVESWSKFSHEVLYRFVLGKDKVDDWLDLLSDSGARLARY